MKRLERLIKIKWLSFSLLGLMSVNAMASKTVGMVRELSGNVFVLKDGRSSQLRAGEILVLGSEILTEEGAIVTFTDYFDHKYHLAGAGHVKLFAEGFELVKGYLWIQSYNQSDEYAWKTANSMVSFGLGEAVLSFDSVTGKSQLMVISDTFQFSNLVDQHLKLELRPGEFSFVDNNYNKGIPRKATRIGYKSYKRVTALFPGRTTIVKHSAPFPESSEPKVASSEINREIASVPAVMANPPGLISKDTETGSTAKTSQVLFLGLKKDRRPASYSHSSGLRHKQRKKSRRTSDVKIKIFGQQEQKARRAPNSLRSKNKKELRKGPSRAPAKMVVSPGNNLDLPAMDVFEKSLVDQYKKQMRHSQEVNSLIEELKNYKADFQKEY